MVKPILIVVDDDPEMANLVANVGEYSGFDVYATTSAREFQKVWAECEPSVIVMDLVMPNIDGVELLIWLAEQNSPASIILMSGYGGKYLDIAEDLGTVKGDRVAGTLAKPFEVSDLEKLLDIALTKHNTPDNSAA